MRRINQWYAYLLQIVQALLNVSPPFLRNYGFRLIIARVGRGVFFDYAIYIKYPWLLQIGDDVSVNRGAQFYSAFKERQSIIIGNDVYIGPNACFFASGHVVGNLSQIVGAGIVVGDHVWIGANAVLLPGVSIGDNCVIGAGSVVTKSVQANSVAAGNPARVIRTIAPIGECLNKSRP